MRRRILIGAVLLALLLGLVVRASYVLVPERTEYGAGWTMYRHEPERSVDVLIFGSSMAYCDIVPADLYAQTGLTSYLMAGPEQTFAITYSYMREALRTQSPSVICLELSGIMFQRYMGFTLANISYMPYFSRNRLEATLYGAERSEWAGLFFPLYNYHDRFGNPLVLLRARPDEHPDPMAGFTPMAAATPQTERGPRDYDLSEETFAENCAWLKKIQTLCAEEGVRLILFQVPSCAYLPEEWMERLRAAAGPEAEIVDLNEDFETAGLDMETDFYDFLHTNAAGARTVTRLLGDYLSAGEPVERHAHDEALWQWRAEEWEKRLAELASA